MSGKKFTIAVLAVLFLVALGGSYLATKTFFVSDEDDPSKTGADAKDDKDIAQINPYGKGRTVEIAQTQLLELVKQVRHKLRECEKLRKELKVRKGRLEATEQALRNEAQGLEDLRVQTASAVADIKSAQAELERTRIRIAKEEQSNLKRNAAIYDRMDSGEAADIIENMCKNNQQDTAVKMMYYMQDRTVAKVLAEIEDKSLAGQISEQLKRIRS